MLEGCYDNIHNCKHILVRCCSRFAVVSQKADAKLNLSFDVRQISNAKYTLLWWSRIFSEVHFVGLQHKSRKPTWIAATLYSHQGGPVLNLDGRKGTGAGVVPNLIFKF